MIGFVFRFLFQVLGGLSDGGSRLAVVCGTGSEDLAVVSGEGSDGLAVVKGDGSKDLAVVKGAGSEACVVAVVCGTGSSSTPFSNSLSPTLLTTKSFTMVVSVSTGSEAVSSDADVATSS